MDRRLVLVSIAATFIGAALAFSLIMSSYKGAPRIQTTGVADIGGTFSLTNHRGQEITDKSLLGKFSLIFFGFTYCPDICPVALQNMTAALDMLGSNAEQITPIFITTDPERDSVEKVAEFVKGFHKSMVGLTGTVDQVKVATKVYRIYAAKKKTADMPGGYTIEHASTIYLMGRDGKYITHFNHSTPRGKECLTKTVSTV